MITPGSLEDPHFEYAKLPEGSDVCMMLCKHCGRLVPTGILNLYDHLHACPNYTPPEINFNPTLADFDEAIKTLNESDFDEYL